MYRIHTGRLNRTSPTVSHRGDENNKQAAKKSTAYGLVRRGFHVGSPLERFDHSLYSFDGIFLRITNDGLSSDSDAAFRRDRLMIVL